MHNLHVFTPICRAIAALLPGQVEVVLHDLTTNRIIHIENGFSPRKAGDDSLTDITSYQSELQPDDTIGPYLKSNSDGARLRTVSALLRNEQGEPTGLLCLNLRLKELEIARDILAAFTDLETDNPSTMVRNDWRETANKIIATCLKELKITANQIRRPERLFIVTHLLQADIFSARNSSDYVSEALGISRAGLYDLIKEAKQHSPRHTKPLGVSI